MTDRSIDRITFLLNANREAGRKLQEELQRHRQEQDSAKAEQARLDKIAATQPSTPRKRPMKSCAPAPTG
jgi:hypothetical protein